MHFLHALLLGVIEGVTEFLPISSTGHLILADRWLDSGVPGSVFEIVIQLGAILAVVWLYRARFWHAVCHLSHDRTEQHFARNLLIAFLPALIVGAFAHDAIKALLFNPASVAVALIVGGVAIVFIERIKPEPAITSTDTMGWKTALFIGLAQCVSMIPGISRAGATIMGAMLARVDRPTAAEFSFFLAVPTMVAASSYDLYKNYDQLSTDGLELIAAGFIAAFLTALFVVKWLVGFVQKHDFAPFAYYRIILGAAMLVLVS